MLASMLLKSGTADGRACNINLPRRTLGYAGESLTLDCEGADLLRLRLGAGLECASEKEGQPPLSSLSQNRRSTGAIAQSDAWRAWMGPPQGASARSLYRPLPNPIRDRRNLPQSPTAVVRTPCPSWPVRWRVAHVGRSIADRQPRLRHSLEDGVENAEAPSSCEGPTRRIFSPARRSLASARTRMVSYPPLAPKTDASSKYDVTGT